MAAAGPSSGGGAGATARRRWDELPPGVVGAVVERLPGQQRFSVASLVSKAWHGHALASVRALHVLLRNGTTAASLGLWLRRHGHRLTELVVTDEFEGVVVHSDCLQAAQRMLVLQGLHGGGRPLPLLRSLSLSVLELTTTDAAMLGMLAVPHLTRLQLESMNADMRMHAEAEGQLYEDVAPPMDALAVQALAPLTGLQELRLPGHDLRDAGAKAIAAAFPQLRALDVSVINHITDVGLAALAQLSLLTYLDVAYMHVSAAGVAQLTRLPLRELCMPYCVLDDEALPHLAALGPGLTALDLSNTRMSLESPSTTTALASLTALECLRLSGCSLAPRGLEALAAGCTSLRKLEMRSCRGLSSVGLLAPLGALPALTRLDAGGLRCLAHPDLSLPSTLAALSRLVHLDVRYCLPADASESARFPRAPSGGGGMATRRSAAGAASFWLQLAEVLPRLSALTYLGWQGNLAPLLQLDAAQAAAQMAAVFNFNDAASQAAAASGLGCAAAGPGLDELLLLLRGLAAATPASALQQLDATIVDFASRWYYQRVEALLAKRLQAHVRVPAAASGSVAAAGQDSSGGRPALLPALLRALLPRLRLLNMSCDPFELDEGDSTKPGVVRCG